jgi:hypothetical protein
MTTVSNASVCTRDTCTPSLSTSPMNLPASPPTHAPSPVQIQPAVLWAHSHLVCHPMRLGRHTWMSRSCGTSASCSSGLPLGPPSRLPHDAHVGGLPSVGASDRAPTIPSRTNPPAAHDGWVRSIRGIAQVQGDGCGTLEPRPELCDCYPRHSLHPAHPSRLHRPEHTPTSRTCGPCTARQTSCAPLSTRCRSRSLAQSFGARQQSTAPGNKYKNKLPLLGMTWQSQFEELIIQIRNINHGTSTEHLPVLHHQRAHV